MEGFKRIIENIRRRLHRHENERHLHRHRGDRHSHRHGNGSHSHKRLHRFWGNFRFQHGSFSCYGRHGLTKLSIAGPGVYKFIAVYCGERLRHRLLEMGFIPGEEMSVIENNGPRGSVMIRIKGAKIALSSEVADKILLKAENNAWKYEH